MRAKRGGNLQRRFKSKEEVVFRSLEGGGCRQEAPDEF